MGRFKNGDFARRLNSAPLFAMLRDEPGFPRRKFILMAFAAGIANASILAIINTAGQNASNNSVSFRYLALFGIAICIYTFAQKEVFRISSETFESMVKRIRDRIARKIHECDLSELEKLSPSEVYSRLTSNTAVISQSSGVLVAGFQSAIIVVFSMAYIATLSKMALFLVVALLVFGIVVYLKKQKGITGHIVAANRKEVEFFERVSDLLDGFVEVKMNKARGEELMAETTHVSSEVRTLKTKFMNMYIANQVFSQYSMYLVMAAVVFILPRLAATYRDAVVEISATLLFIFGPIGAIVTSLPAFNNANISLNDIKDLEHQLDSRKSEMESNETPEQAGMAPFETLQLDGLGFAYTNAEGEPGFSVGPVRFEAKKGDVIFIVGGNGSGKSTLLRLLTGLYTAQTGRILVNGREVSVRRMGVYRQLYSTVFGKFHLFKKLYGFSHISDERVNALLKEMDIAHKTQCVDGRLTNLDLSTGQRKRIALIIALLEDRPIYVFDEWAAEQDPEFRRSFYETILPKLKQAGKTVIAVTHDDHYFHRADRVLKMDFGVMSEYRPGK